MKSKKITFAILGLIMIAGLTLGTVLTSGNLLADTPACSRHSPNAESHQVMIMDDKATPDKVTAKLCDSLTITNMDNKVRIVAFGPHEDHVPYDGIADKVLHQGDTLTVTLNQTGTYRFHDHLQDKVEGFFTVTK